MKKSKLNKIFLISVPLIAVILVICLVIIPKIKSGDNGVENKTETDSGHKIEKMPTNDDSVRSAVDFDHELSKYQPKKDHYNFYFTYSQTVLICSQKSSPNLFSKKAPPMVNAQGITSFNSSSLL